MITKVIQLIKNKKISKNLIQMMNLMEILIKYQENKQQYKIYQIQRRMAQHMEEYQEKNEKNFDKVTDQLQELKQELKQEMDANYQQLTNLIIKLFGNGQQ